MSQALHLCLGSGYKRSVYIRPASNVAFTQTLITKEPHIETESTGGPKGFDIGIVASKRIKDYDRWWWPSGPRGC